MSHIHAAHVGVDLPIIGAQRSFRHDLLTGRVGGRLRHQGRTSVRALDDLSFHFETGDRIGLIGHNGAGKSTLLRVLAGRYPPTAGALDVVGRTVPLLSLGAGMDGDFSGHDNILISGLHLGLSRREIQAQAADIAAMSELGDFLDLPTRTYSAGMQLRLAFAIATAAHPDILLIDEVFGVGDASFYAKAEARMTAIVARANIVVLASHDLGLISRFCNKACVMTQGRLAYVGPVDAAITQYQSAAATRN
jgi:ABC-type polysaccharide/polyol phosphate transport system ATPase subunit